MRLASVVGVLVCVCSLATAAHGTSTAKKPEPSLKLTIYTHEMWTGPNATILRLAAAPRHDDDMHNDKGKNNTPGSTPNTKNNNNNPTAGQPKSGNITSGPQGKTNMTDQLGHPKGNNMTDRSGQPNISNMTESGQGGKGNMTDQSGQPKSGNMIESGQGNSGNMTASGQRKGNMTASGQSKGNMTEGQGKSGNVTESGQGKGGRMADHSTAGRQAGMMSGNMSAMNMEWGSVFVFDSPLRTGPSSSSKALGHSTGTAVVTSVAKSSGGFYVTADHIFDMSDKFNGSRITVIGTVGSTASPAPYFELLVPGGLGYFAGCRGSVKVSSVEGVAFPAHVCKWDFTLTCGGQ